MTSIWIRGVLCLVVLLALSGCIRSVGGPNDNAQERFEFVAVPTNEAQVRQAFESAMGPQSSDLVPGSFVPTGRIIGSRGDQFFAEFQLNDPNSGLSQCSGQAGDTGASWGCGPIGQEVEIPDLPTLTLGGSGTGGTWREASFNVSDEVAYLVATADDGTRYRLEPISGMAWMEWRAEHGNLSVTAFDAGESALTTIVVDDQ